MVIGDSVCQLAVDHGDGCSSRLGQKRWTLPRGAANFITLPMESNFSTIDWLIVGAYLLGTVAIGVYVNRFIKGMGDFLVAGRSLKTRLGVATMIGSELGLVTAMFAAQKGFTGGFAAFHIGLLAGITALMVGLTGFIVVPLRRTGVMTIPQFYEQRFGSRKLRIFGGLLLALSGILNMGLFLKAGATFVTGLTGVEDDTTIKLVMTSLLVLVLIYTALGGMVSVIITDYVQFVVLSLGLLIACGVAISQLGWQTIVQTVETVHGQAGFNPFDGDGFGPSYFVWMIFLGIISCAVWQTAAIRACAAENEQVVKRLYTWSSIGFMIRFLIPQFLGICALTFLWHNESAHALFFNQDGSIMESESLRAMPVFLSQLLPVGLIGLVGAGMIAAFMSTHDTYLLCWASVLAEDVVNPITGGKLPEATRLRLARIFLVMIAAFLLVWSMWYELGQDLWDYMAVSGAIYSTGAFAVMLAGLYWKRASRVGAGLALGVGALALFGLKPVQALFGVGDWFKSNDITSAHVGLVTVVLAVILMVAGSLLFPHRNHHNSEGTSV